MRLSGLAVAVTGLTFVVGPLGSLCVAQQDSALVARLRRLNGSMFADVAVVQTRPTTYQGKHSIVVERAVSTDSSAILFTIWVVNEGMTALERRVKTFAAPWPDYVVRIDSVTPDSVYVTGRSARYRRTLLRSYEWWPLGSRPPARTDVRPSVATAAPVCGDTVRVDLNAITIAGIWMNQSIEPVTREVGAANVTVQTGSAEGHHTQMYTIKLCGREVRRLPNSVSWSDPAFRTPEGLGIGSPLAAFDTAYGKGDAIGEEGNSVRYSPIDGEGHFFVYVAPACYGIGGHHWIVDPNCQAVGISFIVSANP